MGTRWRLRCHARRGSTHRPRPRKGAVIPIPMHMHMSHMYTCICHRCASPSISQRSSPSLRVMRRRYASSWRTRCREMTMNGASASTSQPSSREATTAVHMHMCYVHMRVHMHTCTWASRPSFSRGYDGPRQAWHLPHHVHMHMYDTCICAHVHMQVRRRGTSSGVASTTPLPRRSRGGHGATSATRCLRHRSYAYAYACAHSTYVYTSATRCLRHRS